MFRSFKVKDYFPKVEMTFEEGKKLQLMWNLDKTSGRMSKCFLKSLATPVKGNLETTH